MTEYIDREALKNDIAKSIEPFNTGSVFRAINRQIAADVAPVVHGRWVHLGGDEWCCSACGFVIATEGSWDKPAKKYCEDCGARMDIQDGGDNDAAD